MKLILRQILLLCCIIGFTIIAEQSFVLKKEKKKKLPSTSILKERYAQEAGNLIKTVPTIQKHTAQLQREVIKDLDDILNGASGSRIAKLSKEQLEERLKKIVQLNNQLQAFDLQLKKNVRLVATMELP